MDVMLREGQLHKGDDLILRRVIGGKIQGTSAGQQFSRRRVMMAKIVLAIACIWVALVIFSRRSVLMGKVILAVACLWIALAVGMILRDAKVF